MAKVDEEIYMAKTRRIESCKKNKQCHSALWTEVANANMWKEWQRRAHTLDAKIQFCCWFLYFLLLLCCCCVVMWTPCKFLKRVSMKGAHFVYMPRNKICVLTSKRSFRLSVRPVNHIAYMQHPAQPPPSMRKEW